MEEPLSQGLVPQEQAPLAPLTEQGLVACTVLALISIHEGFLTLKSDLGLCD